MPATWNLTRTLASSASGVSEVVRSRFGKTDSILTAAGVPAVERITEIDLDNEEAAQYIRRAEAEMQDSGGPTPPVVEKCRQALFLLQRHDLNILSQPVLLLLINLTIEVASNSTNRYNQIMGDAEAAIDVLASMLPDETKRPAFKEKIMAEFAAAGGLTAHTAAQEEPPRPVATAPAASPSASGLAWPSEKWKNSPEKLSRKQRQIVPFLRRVWKPFIEKNNVLITRAILRAHDADAAEALEKSLRSHPLPKDIPIITTEQLRKHLKDHPMSANSLPALGA